MTCTPRVLLSALLVNAAALLAGGCAAYEYHITQPAEFAGVVESQVMVLEPLEYEARDEGTRLALRVINPTGEDVTLLGERSYLVDPGGETRAISGGTIAPGSYITMDLPPHITVRSGPRFGVGVGMGTGYQSGYFGSVSYYDPWARYGPAYAYGRERVDMWRWITGTVRLRLVYEAAGETFEHNLAFERRQVQ